MIMSSSSYTYVIIHNVYCQFASFIPPAGPIFQGGGVGLARWVNLACEQQQQQQQSLRVRAKDVDARGDLKESY